MTVDTPVEALLIGFRQAFSDAGLDSSERIMGAVIAVSAIAFVVGWLAAGAVVWLGAG